MLFVFHDLEHYTLCESLADFTAFVNTFSLTQRGRMGIVEFVGSREIVARDADFGTVWDKFWRHD